MLISGTASHAQNEIYPPVDPTNESESLDADSTSDPELEAAIVAQQQLAEDFALYKNLLENGMTAEADVVAKRIVELSIRENGFENSDTAKALTNLAIVQHRNKDYETAQQNYEAAIGIIERVEDRLNSALINPLRGLGAAQMAAGRPDLALDSFGRAQHVSHVNEGPHNLDQVTIIESLAEIYIHIGEFEQAYDLQDRIYELYARKYTMDSDQIVPALYKRAEWQHRLRLYGRERDTFRRIIKIIEVNHGKESLALITPLTGLAKAYLYVGDFDRDFYDGNSLTSGEIYIKRAKRIAEEHPDADWIIKERTFLSLADFYVFSDKAGKAKKVLQDTWDLLSEDDSRLVSRYNNLESVVMLQDVYIPKYYGMDENSEPIDDDEQLQQGKVVAKFMVNNRGRPRDFEIIESYPPGIADMEKNVLRELRRLIYRPRLENREVIEIQNITYTHEFFYRESDLAPVVDEEEEVADASK